MIQVERKYLFRTFKLVFIQYFTQKSQNIYEVQHFDLIFVSDIQKTIFIQIQPRDKYFLIF
ncbi:hypothetical protein pb186bvf_004525 [Paramecium bursaria]